MIFQDGFQFWNRSRVSLKAKYELRKKVFNLIRYNQFLKQQRSGCFSAKWRVLGKEGERMAKWCREWRQVPACKTRCDSTGRNENCSVGIAGTWVCKVMGVFRGKPEAASWLLVEIWEVMSKMVTNLAAKCQLQEMQLLVRAGGSLELC